MKNNLMTHVVAGYPSMNECEKIILAMAETGVAFIEIQIPFSDPIADGPTIMHANEQALLNGVTIEDCFKFIKRLKKKIKTQILIMTYFNIPFRYGLEKFCRKVKECRVYGLIIPDIPFDEEKYENYLTNCKKYGLHAIQVISPITPEKRLKRISELASGFVYCVSTFGTTGTRKHLNPRLDSYLKKIKRYIKIPLAVGFGISKKQHLQALEGKAEIAVVGSAIMKVINKSTRRDLIPNLKKFIKNLCD